MNLIPDLPGSAPNYWCTWGTQNSTVSGKAAASAFVGDQGAKRGRDNLNEEVVFGPGGWIEDFEGIKGDLYFMFDDGWDVPYGIAPDKNRHRFGSLIVDPERFPFCTGTPEERLKKLNERVIAGGWRGAALWVAAQAAGETDERQLPDDQARQYWIERLKWCENAGIRLWKVDWGVHGNNLHFRRMLTELGHEYAPGLHIEHAVPMMPLNGITLEGTCRGSGRFIDSGVNEARRVISLAQFADSVRIYDLLVPLTTAAALDRCIFGLAAARDGLVNVEDEAYLAAILGCTAGIMRSARWKSTREKVTKRNQRMLEIHRSIRWQRLAPAWAGREEEPVFTSREILEDAWIFPENSTWFAAVFNKQVTQAAPAIVSRGMALPGVTDAGCGVPFAAASLHPNGSVAVGTLPRLSPEKGLHVPEADIALKIDCTGRFVGVFGGFHELSLPVRGSGIRVMAQDLAADHAEDITSRCVIADGLLKIPGPVLGTVGMPQGDDVSRSGVVLKISR